MESDLDVGPADTATGTDIGTGAGGRRVVVTGLGVVSPLGAGVDEFWSGLLAGDVPDLPLTRFDASRYRVRRALTVSGAPPLTGKDETEPALEYARQAAAAALCQGRLYGSCLRRCGLALATTAAGWTAGRDLLVAHLEDDRDRFNALLQRPAGLLKQGPLAWVARELGLEGPAVIPSSACAAASAAIAWAADAIRRGAADAVLAGGTDPLTEIVFAGFHSMRLLAPDACRPFSAGRRGLVLGEGAAVLLLENEECARRRGVRPLARLAGWNLGCDARHVTTPDEAGIARTMRAAIEHAGFGPEDIDYISAHGTGSAANDLAEARAIAALLGDRASTVPVGAIKSTIGHTQGVAGAFAAVAAVLSLQTGRLPPIAGFLEPDPELPDISPTTTRTEHRPRAVLVNAFGFGGANAALVLTAPDGTPRAPGRSGSGSPSANGTANAATSAAGTGDDLQEGTIGPGHIPSGRCRCRCHPHRPRPLAVVTAGFALTPRGEGLDWMWTTPSGLNAGAARHGGDTCLGGDARRIDDAPALETAARLTSGSGPAGALPQLDRISTLILHATEAVLSAAAAQPGPQRPWPRTGICLGTFYGSQTIHEDIARALHERGPRWVEPQDFAISTFNAPGAVAAAALGLEGPNLVFLSSTGGAEAIGYSARLLAGDRASAMVAGGYDQVSPFLARCLEAWGLDDWAEGLGLLILEDPRSAQQRGARPQASILGHAARAPREEWATAAAVATVIDAALEQSGVDRRAVAAVVLSPGSRLRDAQLEAVDQAWASNGGHRPAVIDLSPLLGHTLGAAAPLALLATIEARRRDRFPPGTAVRGHPAMGTDDPVVILACGLMSSTVAVVIQPHG